MKRYQVKEFFYSIQGEGARAGTAAVFVRFAGCNLDCSMETMGWQCDTDFIGGDAYTIGTLLDAIRALAGSGWIIFTGGEPALQLDQQLVDVLHAAGYKLAIETNGTKCLPSRLDWICVSPKYAATSTHIKANEVKYVLAAGQEPPETLLRADYMLVSPAFKGNEPDPGAMEWCIQWVLENPEWRLSVQQHKYWGLR